MAESWTPTLRKKFALTVFALLSGLGRVRRHAPPTSPAVKKILVIELWHIGDVVLAMPFLDQLRAKFPGASITLLARSFAAEILAHTGLVDDVIVADLGWSGADVRYNPFRYRVAEMTRVCREVRRRNFDLAFTSRLHLREHAILAASGASARIGYAFGNNPGALTHPVPFATKDTHKTEDWMRLLDLVGGRSLRSVPRLRITSDEKEWAADFLRAAGISADDEIIGIHPGASLPARRWPLSAFTGIARKLAADSAVRVLGFVDPLGYGEELASAPGLIPVRVDLRRMMALLEKCSVVVCNDSGPMHLAAALGIPVVAIFGARRQKWYAPLPNGHELISESTPCSACGDVCSFSGPYCLGSIRQERVLDAIGRIRQRPAAPV